MRGKSFGTNLSQAYEMSIDIRGEGAGAIVAIVPIGAEKRYRTEVEKFGKVRMVKYGLGK